MLGRFVIIYSTLFLIGFRIKRHLVFSVVFLRIKQKADRQQRRTISSLIFTIRTRKSFTQNYFFKISRGGFTVNRGIDKMQAIGNYLYIRKDVTLLIFHGSKNTAIAILVGRFQDINCPHLQCWTWLPISIGGPEIIALIIFYTNPNRGELKRFVAILKISTRVSQRKGAVGGNTRFCYLLKFAIIQVVGINLTLRKRNPVLVESSRNCPNLGYRIGHNTLLRCDFCTTLQSNLNFFHTKREVFFISLQNWYDFLRVLS